MKTLLLAFFLLASLVGHAQIPAWAFVLPLNDLAGAVDVATGPGGNVYVTGRFTGSLQLGSTLLTSASPNACLYIAKLTPNGAVLWATKLEGGTNVMPESIAVDALGNAYVTGAFSGTMTYPTGYTTSRLTLLPFWDQGGTSIFLLKCSPGGVVSWVQQADGSSPDAYGHCTGNSVAVDAAGNSYICGRAEGNNVSFNGFSYGQRRNHGFIASYNPLGTLRWVKVMAGIPPGFGTSPSHAVAADNRGGCYLTGNSIRGWVLDGTTFMSEGNGNYLVRFNAATGALLWAVPTPGQSQPRALATDALGRAYLGGTFSGTTPFGPTSLTSAGTADGFVACYTPLGAVAWATAVGGPNSDAVTDLAVDQVTGRIFTTGMTRVSALVVNQSFLGQLNAFGGAPSQQLVGGPGTSTGARLAIDSRNIIYTTGSFTGSCSFTPLALSGTVAQTYFGRYGRDLTGGGGTGPRLPVLSPFPNPVHDLLTLTLRNPQLPGQATLYNPQGVPMITQTLTKADTELKFDTSALPNGLYVLRLQSAQEISTHVVTVQH
jgi:outer membrane protein assembly factor BamB